MIWESVNFVVAVSSRIPRHMIPVHYDLRLIPFLEEGNFTTSGELELVADFDDAVNDPYYHSRIYFHAREIAVDEESVSVSNILISDLEVAGHEYDLERDFYVIHMASPLRRNDFVYQVGSGFANFSFIRFRGDTFCSTCSSSLLA